MPPRTSRNSAREPFVSLQQVKDVLDKAESLKVKSAKTYINHLRLFLRDLKTDNVYSLLNDYEKTDEYIQKKTAERTGRPITLETMRTYYVTLNASAGHVDFVKPTAKAFFQQRQDEYNRLAHDKRAQNLVLDKHDGNPPRWDDLKDLAKQFSNGAKYGVNHLIVSLYTLIPPRRGEYRTLIYLDKKPDTASIGPKPRKATNELRDSNRIPWNYVYPNDDNTYTMVLRDFKTNHTYNTYEKVLPEDLSAIIKGYIDKQKIEPNTVVFRTNRTKKSTGEPYRTLKDGNWSGKVAAAFAVKYTLHRIAIDELRHAFINSLKLNDMTSAEKEAIAYDMSHSLKYQDLYRQYVTDDKPAQGEPSQEEQPPPAPIDDDPQAQQIDLEIKMATLAMLKSQKLMFDTQTEYYRAKTRTLVTSSDST